MHSLFSLTDIPTLKGHLALELPGVRSSHRVEALARGLGWNTYAAARAALEAGAVERTVDNRAFIAYPTDHGFPDMPFDALGRTVARVKFGAQVAAINAVLEATPLLTTHGYGIYQSRRERLTPEDREEKFQEGRRDLLGSRSIDGFLRATAFLARFSKRRTINRRFSSYGLKHHAEQFHSEQGHPDPYVSNGVFIAAAIHLGFTAKPDGLVAFFNISTRPTTVLPARTRTNTLPDDDGPPHPIGSARDGAAGILQDAGSAGDAGGARAGGGVDALHFDRILGGCGA